VEGGASEPWKGVSSLEGENGGRSGQVRTDKSSKCGQATALAAQMYWGTYPGTDR
jgi:hypothetical protein